MEHIEETEYKDPKEKDFAYNWVHSSVFLFYLQVFCILAFTLGGVMHYTPSAIREHRL